MIIIVIDVDNAILCYIIIRCKVRINFCAVQTPSDAKYVQIESSNVTTAIAKMENLVNRCLESIQVIIPSI